MIAILHIPLGYIKDHDMIININYYGNPTEVEFRGKSGLRSFEKKFSDFLHHYCEMINMRYVDNNFILDIEGQFTNGTGNMQSVFADNVKKNIDNIFDKYHNKVYDKSKILQILDTYIDFCCFMIPFYRSPEYRRDLRNIVDYINNRKYYYLI